MCAASSASKTVQKKKLPTPEKWRNTRKIVVPYHNYGVFNFKSFLDFTDLTPHSQNGKSKVGTKMAL